MQKSILIVNEINRETGEIANRLTNSQTDTIYVKNIHDAFVEILKREFCLIILDENMSAEDDHKLLKVIRKSKTTPILILSSQADHSGRLRAFRAGAHAYMGKPYSLEECLAQVESLMQLYIDNCSTTNHCYTLICGNDLIIDSSTRQVFLKGKELNITRKEFDLLFYLASNPGKVFSREKIYDYVWDNQFAFNVDEVVKAHIKALRYKLSNANVEYIKNVWGIGYRFEKDIRVD